MRCFRTTRYPCGLAVLLACGVGLLLTANAADAPPAKSSSDSVSEDPFPIRRIVLPRDRLAKEIERLQQGILVQLPLAELEDRIRSAAKAQKVVREEPRLLEMHYQARLLNAGLEDNGLEGTARWSIHPGANSPGVLSVDGMQLAVRSARWPDDRLAVFSRLDAQNPNRFGLLIEQPTDRLLEFSWSARGIPTPAELRFDLSLPACPRASLDLELPPDWVPFVPQSEALLTGPSAVPNSNHQTWRIALGGLAHLELFLRPRSVGQRRSPLRTRSIVSVQEVHPAAVLTQTQIEFEAPHGGVTDLIVEHDPEWIPSEVSLVNLESWKRDVPSHRVSIRLREPTEGGQLRIVGFAPVRSDRTRSWVSPGVKLADGIAGPERLELRIVPELQLFDWKPGNFRLLKREPTGDRYQILTLQSGMPAEGTVDLRPTSQLRLVGSEYDIRQDSEWTVTPERCALTTAMKATVLRGVVGHIPVRLPAGWELERIVAVNPNSPPEWTFVRGPDGLIFIDLLRPVQAGNELTMILHLLRRGFDPGKDTTRSVALPEVIPLGAHESSGNLTIRVSAALDAVAPQAMPESNRIGPAAASTPSKEMIRRYSYVGPVPVGSLHFALRPSKSSILAATEVYLSQGRAHVVTRLHIRPDSASRRTVTVFSAVPGAEPLVGKVMSGNNSIASIEPFPQSPFGILAGFGARTGLDAALRVATPRPDRWRQIALTRPLDQPVTVELTTASPLRLRPVAEVLGFAELAGTAAGSSAPAPYFPQEVPLLQTFDTDVVRGEIVLAIPAGSEIEGRTTGLVPAPSRTACYPAFHYGAGSIGLTLVRKTAESFAALPQVDGACLVTRADRAGTRSAHLRFHVRSSEMRSLPIRFPEATIIEGIRIAGQSLEEATWSVRSVDSRVELRVPIPTGTEWRAMEIDYRLPARSGSLGITLESPLPVLPVPFPSVRRIWRLGPGLLPLSSSGLSRWPGGGDSSPRAGWPSPGAWFDRITHEDPTIANREFAGVQASNPDGGVPAKTLQQTLVQSALQPTLLLLDVQAVSERGITPARTVPTANGVPVWEELGLVAVGVPAGIVLTTPAVLSRWQVESGDRHRLPPSILEALNQAARNGRDSSARFRTVADWLESNKFTSESDPFDRSLADQVGWTTWESTASETSAISIVDVGSLRMSGWIVAAILTAAATILVGRVGRIGVLLPVFWLSGCGVLLLALPDALRSVVVGPMLAGLLVALLAVWRTRRSFTVLPDDSTELIRHSVRKKPSIAGATGVVAMLALCALPSHAAAPDPVAVFLIASPENPEVKQALVPPDLLERLSRMAERKLPLPDAVITRVEYQGRFRDKSTIEIDARFYLRSFVDSAELVLPLSGVRIREALLGGAPAFPQNDGADRYRFALNKRGEDRLDLKFSLNVTGSGSEREARFGVPDVLQSELRFAVSQAVEGFQIVNWRGVQQLLEREKQLRTDLGRTREVYFRWRESGATALVRARVQEASVWDIHPGSASLLSVLDYRITQEGTTRFRVAVPKGLEVARLEVRPEAPASSPLPAWIKDWKLAPESEPGSYRTLTVELHSSLSGSARLVLELVPLRPFAARPELRFPAALDVLESQTRVAYRLHGLEIAGEPGRNGLADLNAAQFLDETWKRLNEEKNSLAVTRAYRKLPGQDAYLRPILKPLPAAKIGSSELVWWLDPRRPDVWGKMRFTASEEALSLVEWDLAPAVAIHAVRGSNIDYWTRTGSRVQVWLKQPAPKAQFVWDGSLTGQPTLPEAVPLELPAARLHGVAQPETIVRLRAPEGFTTSVERFDTTGRPIDSLEPREIALRMLRPFDPLRVLVRTPQRDARFSMFGTVAIDAGKLRIRSELSADLRKDRAHAFTLHATRLAGLRCVLDVPKNARIVDSVVRGDERSWSLELGPREQDSLQVVLTLDRPLTQPTERVLPNFAVTQDGFPLPPTEQRYAFSSPELQVLKAKQFLELDKPDSSTPSSLPVTARIWKRQSDSGELSILASPGEVRPRRPVRIILADLQAARLGDQWVYRGTFDVLHVGSAELRWRIGEGSTLESLLLDGNEVRESRTSYGVAALALPAEGGYRHIQSVWRRTAPSWETPTFSIGDSIVPIDRTLWTIDLPPGQLAHGAEPISAALAALERAEAMLNTADGATGFPISEEASARAVGRALNWLRLGDIYLAGKSVGNEERTPEGKSIAERLKDLRERAFALRVEHPRSEPSRSGSSRESNRQSLPYGDAFQSGIPIRYLLPSAERVLSIELTESGTGSRHMRWLPMLILTGSAGLLAGLLLLARRSTLPEQLALIGIVGAAAFPFPEGVVFLGLTLGGVLLRATRLSMQVMRRLWAASNEASTG